MPSELNAAEGGLAGTVVLAAGYGLKWAVDAFLKARRSPEQKAADAAGLDAQSIKNAGALMDGMRTDLDALREEMRLMKIAHREEMDAARRDHAAREAECDRRLDELSGQLRSAQASVISLLRQLRDPTSTLPGGALDGAVIALTDGRAEVVSTKADREIK